MRITAARWRYCPNICAKHFSTATGMFSPASISTFSITAGTPRGRKKFGSKRGGRAGFRSTGAFSIPARCIGIARFLVALASSRLGLAAAGERENSRQDAGATQRIVTYREFVQNGLSPRMLAQGIAERSGRENISEVFLSPDAFAHRTAEASIAEQLGDVLTVNGLPRPALADDDRIGGWQFMYQMLESDAWVITENCDEVD